MLQSSLQPAHLLTATLLKMQQLCPTSYAIRKEFDELVNDWMYDLELEDLASGKQRDMQQDGIIVKAPLASIFGTTLEVLSDSNVETY